MPTMAPFTSAAAIAALALAGLGCGSSSSSSNSDSGSKKASSAPAAKAKPVRAGKIKIANYTFAPAAIEVKKGTAVSFTNSDATPHTATSKANGAFDSGDVTKAKPGKVVFSKAGTFAYYCVYHPYMTGTVKVDP
jgi:plastocyanin